MFEQSSDACMDRSGALRCRTVSAPARRPEQTQQGRVFQPGHLPPPVGAVPLPLPFFTDPLVTLQTHSFREQLELGARFFDVRPVKSAGTFKTGHYSHVNQVHSWQGACHQIRSLGDRACQPGPLSARRVSPVRMHQTPSVFPASDTHTEAWEHVLLLL